MTLIGFVSDEDHLALCDVKVEILKDNQTIDIINSTSRGAIYSDELQPGEYEVILQKEGYNPKRSKAEIGEEFTPQRFRLLSDRLLGYVWPKWVTTDGAAQYRIHATEDTRVTLWRYGEQKEFVKSIDWHGEFGPRTNSQDVPDGDFTQTGVEWTSRRPGTASSQQTIQAPSRSGLYYFHAEEKESGKFFSFPWVVAPESPQSPVAVLSATMTWNAYNSFGGRCNYINLKDLPKEPTVDAHAELDRYSSEIEEHGYENYEYQPISFDRPAPCTHIPKDTKITDQIEGRNEMHTAPAEWRLLGWLEREDYDYDLYSDNQFHSDVLDLDEYDVLIVHTHPEYWTHEMYKKLKNWVLNRAGKLLYLGGNGIHVEVDVIDDSKVRYLNHSTMYDKRLKNPDLDPNEFEYESTFHESAEPQGELLGERTTLAGIMTAAPYTVLDESHWVFNSTNLKDGDSFGTENLSERFAGGASGFETDKLSRFAPQNVEKVAKGKNPNEGGGEILYYETQDGGEVFSTGSIMYTTSLLVDNHISQITSNVLDEFIGT